MDPTPCRVNKGAAPKTKSLSNLGAAYKNSVFFFCSYLKNLDSSQKYWNSELNPLHVDTKQITTR